MRWQQAARFGVAAIGMVLSLVTFWACRKLVIAGERRPAKPSPENSIALPVREPNEPLRIQSLFIIFGVVALFWMAFIKTV